VVGCIHPTCPEAGRGVWPGEASCCACVCILGGSEEEVDAISRHPGCVPVKAQRVEETAHIPIVVVSTCSLDTCGTVLGREYMFELQESALRVSVSGVKEKRKV
jgi:hypothetical protein